MADPESRVGEGSACRNASLCCVKMSALRSVEIRAPGADLNCCGVGLTSRAAPMRQALTHHHSHGDVVFLSGFQVPAAEPSCRNGDCRRVRGVRHPHPPQETSTSLDVQSPNHERCPTLRQSGRLHLTPRPGAGRPRKALSGGPDKGVMNWIEITSSDEIGGGMPRRGAR